LIQKADPSFNRASAAGVDVGATLAKLAIRASDGQTRFHLMPAQAIERVARKVESSSAAHVGLTGGGATELASLLRSDTVRVFEFDAWRRGAAELLRLQGSDCSGPFLLVSLGTGTSAMLVKGGEAIRLGGTALGGGTIVGLGAALTGSANFSKISELAQLGDRRRVDLLVSDIYPAGELSLPGDLNAASFAKLALREQDGPADPRDLAHAIMGLVAENVGLICAGLAASAGVSRIVYGGSTLRDNPTLIDILGIIAATHKHEVVFLENPEFAGAMGALSVASSAAESDSGDP
jgi:type II pantothenate kinase